MTPWEQFEKEALGRIFAENNEIIDIGGGLRFLPDKNNRYNAQREWLRESVTKVHYQILDKVHDYNPDIIGDIHHLPLADNSIDAIICIAVLEHVEEPHQAVREMYRVLKPGGMAYIYVPFLYYYHPLKGYYGDFFRYTIDGIKYLCRNFSSFDYCTVRGAFETVNNLYPRRYARLMRPLMRWLDIVLHRTSSNKTSGYNIFVIK